MILCAVTYLVASLFEILWISGDGDGVMRVTRMVGMGIEACRGGWGWIQSLWGWMRTGTKVCPCAGLYCD